MNVPVILFTCVSLPGIQLEIRIPGNTTTYTISGLEAGLEYNINVFAVINNSISVPASITVSTCKCSPLGLFYEIFPWQPNGNWLTNYESNSFHQSYTVL